MPGEASLTVSWGSNMKGTLPKKSTPFSAYDSVFELEDVRLLVAPKVDAGRKVWSSAVATQALESILVNISFKTYTHFVGCPAW